ncbi:MAG: hypothetical protein ACFFBD_00815 [Candidatus Hodarchaeota archaeon]
MKSQRCVADVSQTIADEKGLHRLAMFIVFPFIFPHYQKWFKNH